MKALVLGGSGHLGGHVLARLASEGVDTTFTWWTNEAAAVTLEAAGHRGLRVDLRDADALAAALEDVGPIDALIHCAATNRWAPLAELSVAEFDEALAVTVRAAFVACRSVVPGMAARGAGSVVFAAGLVADRLVPAPAHYAASQAALLGLARSIAKEHGKQGVRANLVAISDLSGGLQASADPALIANYLEHAALGRRGTADEAARAIVWLALHGSYASGSVLPVTGGL